MFGGLTYNGEKVVVHVSCGKVLWASYRNELKDPGEDVEHWPQKKSWVDHFHSVFPFCWDVARRKLTAFPNHPWVGFSKFGHQVRDQSTDHFIRMLVNRAEDRLVEEGGRGTDRIFSARMHVCLHSGRPHLESGIPTIGWSCE